MDEREEKNRKTVLMADPDEFLALAYKDGIEQAGFEVIIASDGHQTLEILKNETPDAVLLELILPKVNGFEVLEYIKKSKKLRKIPVLVLTSLSQSDDEVEAKEFGAADFLVKSETTVQDLLERLDRIFSADN